MVALALAGCGVAYQAGTRIKATRMSDSLQVGETSPQVHHSWGEPDLRTYLPGEVEVWSYPYKPNSNDVTAALLYTSSKDGDKGTFLDLKFVGGKLVSWQEAEHTMPAKGHTGISMGINQGPIGNVTRPSQAPCTTSHTVGLRELSVPRGTRTCNVPEPSCLIDPERGEWW
jgi:hypothetical protein